MEVWQSLDYSLGFFLRTRAPVENINPEGGGLSDLPSRAITRTESNVDLFLNTEMKAGGKGQRHLLVSSLDFESLFRMSSLPESNKNRKSLGISIFESFVTSRLVVYYVPLTGVQGPRF